MPDSGNSVLDFATDLTPELTDFVYTFTAGGQDSKVTFSSIKSLVLDDFLTEVDNTSDANKPVSTAQQAEFDGVAALIFDPAGPYADVTEAGLAGVRINDPWYDATGQVFRRVLNLNAETAAHYAKFANDVPIERKFALSSAIDDLKAEGLWDDVILFAPFGSLYNAATGTTRYALVGPDLTGVVAAPELTTQEFTADQTFSLLAGATRTTGSVVSWSSAIATVPATGTLACLQNTSASSGRTRLYYDGGGIKTQTQGGGSQQIITYSPATYYNASSSPRVYIATVDASLDEGRFSLDGAAPYVTDYNGVHTDGAMDLVNVLLSEDTAYHGQLVYDRVLTDSEMVTINTIIREHLMPLEHSILLDGDSIMAIDYLPSAGTSYKGIFTADVSARATVVDNLATGGETTVDILAGVTAQITGAPADADGTDLLYIFNGCTNDLSRRGAGTAGDWSNSDIYGRLVSIAAAARAEGRKAICLTATQTFGKLSTAYNADVLLINQMIKDGVVSGDFDGVILLHETLAAEDPSYPSNPLIMADGVHPDEELGQQLMGQAFVDYLSAQ